MGSPHSDDFTTLSNWTASGMSAAGGLVKATAGGVSGSIYRSYGANGEQATIVARIVPDKSDTTGRWVLVAQGDASWGTGVNYKAGTGFRVGMVQNSAPYESTQLTLLADASVVDDQPYWVVLHIDSQSSVRLTVARIYDFMGRLVASGVIDANNDAWYPMSRVIVAANSAASTVSRFCCDPNPFGSPTTVLNRVMDVVGQKAYGNNANQRYGIYSPGAGFAKGILAVQLHGAGTWSADEAMGGQGNAFAPVNASNAWVDALMRAGVPVITPSEYSAAAGNTNSFGSPDAYTLTVNQINEAKALLGSDTKIVLVCQSMGTLMGLRLVTGGDVSNIVAVCLYDPLSSLSLAYTDPLNGTFVAPMNAAWGGAIGTLATYDAHTLLASTPALFRGIEWYVSYCLDDTVVYPSRYAIPFVTALANAGIPYTVRSRAAGGHVSLTKLIPTSDAAEFAGLAAGAERFNGRALRTALGLATASLDTTLGAQSTAIGLVGTNVSAIQSKLPSASAKMAGEGTTAKNLDQVTGVAEVLTRDLEPPAPAFTFRASRRADGTFTTDRPLRLRPGTVENVRIGIDTSLIGPGIVTSVTAPEIDGGSLTVDGESVFDTMATLVVAGEATAGETRYIDIAIVKRSVGTLQLLQEVIVGSA